jgi:hypothetical protein
MQPPASERPALRIAVVAAGFRPDILELLALTENGRERGVARPGHATWGDNPPVSQGGPTVGNYHQIACKYNGKWVGIARPRGRKGAAGRMQGDRAAPLALLG